jgi:hypothetical protein
VSGDQIAPMGASGWQFSAHVTLNNIDFARVDQLLLRRRSSRAS